MKKVLSRILVLGTVIAVAIAYPKDDPSSSDIKKFADTAKDYTDYYTSAKTYVEVATWVLKAIGFINPGGDDEKFKMLQKDVETVAADIDWKQTESYIGDHRSQATTAMTLLRELQTCNPAVSCTADQLVKPTKGDAVDNDSLLGVNGILDPGGEDTAFYRPYDSAQAAGMKFLGYTMSDLINPYGNMIYDWRLGIPALLQIISYRLQVIAALDPNFRNDGKYNDLELNRYRNAIIWHYNTMLSGVRCGSTVGGREPFRCADIHTGYSVSARRSSGGWVWYSAWQRFWTDQLSSAQGPRNQTDEEILTTLRTLVTSHMPLYEIKATIDSLYQIMHVQLDLTEKSQRITTAAPPHLCLDVTGFESQPIDGRAAQLSACNGNSSQRWIYDRKLGTIKTPATGTTTEQCLGLTDWGSGSHVVGQGWYVGTADCTGSDYQKWTYDPETKTLLNAWGGTVLDVQWDNLQPGTLVWTWSLNYSDAQLWQADQNPPCKSLPCGGLPF